MYQIFYLSFNYIRVIKFIISIYISDNILNKITSQLFAESPTFTLLRYPLHNLLDTSCIRLQIHIGM